MQRFIYLATDELQVTGALGVAVTSTILGTSLVGGVARHATILLHSDEVEGTIETALEGGQVNIESELVVHEVEHLELVRSVHEIESGANVGAVLVLGEELEGEGVTAGGGTIGRAIVGALDGTLLGTLGASLADGLNPLISIVAVVITVGRVEPAPVGVNDDLGVDGRAAAGSGTLLPRHLGVSLGLLLADLLGGNQRGEESKGRGELHCDEIFLLLLLFLFTDGI